MKLQTTKWGTEVRLAGLHEGGVRVLFKDDQPIALVFDDGRAYVAWGKLSPVYARQWAGVGSVRGILRGIPVAEMNQRVNEIYGC